MSANANVLRRAEVIGSSTREVALPPGAAARASNLWNPEDFAREQIRGLVRQVFFANGNRAVKQVVFSAADPDVEISNICEQVAYALARETHADVAFLDSSQEVVNRPYASDHYSGGTSIKSLATQLAINLWRVQRVGLGECADGPGAMHWLPCLAALRNEFGYVVIQGPAAGISSEAASLGQMTDGIVLVLGARKTRQATALKIKETLQAAQCRILGTVLTERTFPIPQRIYHWI
ncbi:MAG: hypothetical protein WAL56_08625 [Candidatus Sulfotelmatobacter sp.]